MKQYPYEECKDTIHSLCILAAHDCTTREAFFQKMETYPHVALQGYDSQGTLFYWNAAATDLYGYREDEALGQNLFDLILPAQMRKLACDMIAAADKTGHLPETGPCDLLRKSGRFITVYSGHIMLRWDDVPVFFCLDLAIAEKTAPAHPPQRIKNPALL